MFLNVKEQLHWVNCVRKTNTSTEPLTSNGDLLVWVSRWYVLFRLKIRNSIHRQLRYWSHSDRIFQAESEIFWWSSCVYHVNYELNYVLNQYIHCCNFVIDIWISPLICAPLSLSQLIYFGLHVFSFRGILVRLLRYLMLWRETSLKLHSTVNDNCVQDIRKIILNVAPFIWSGSAVNGMMNESGLPALRWKVCFLEFLLQFHGRIGVLNI